jgi:hypothetical protein
MLGPKSKEATEAQLARLKGLFAKPFPLRPYPGVRFMWVPNTDTHDFSPAYVVAAPNQEGSNFIMVDFIRHNGITESVGTDRWPTDVIHNLKNNVHANLGLINYDFAELCDIGSPNGRWRDGKPGPAGPLAGKTLILCGPGPSLEKNADAITRLRKDNKDVVILAFNRAVRRIKADYAVLIERWIPEDWRDKTVLDLQQECTLVTVPQVHQALVPAWPNSKVYWGRVGMGPFGRVPEMKDLKMIDAMASTSAAIALRVAYELGPRKIILCGVDFCSPMKLQIDRVYEALDDGKARRERILSLANAVVDEDGIKATRIASQALADDIKCQNDGWVLQYVVDNFYFDQPVSKTEYAKDPRFARWQPVMACNGTVVGTTGEFFQYAEQLKTVIAVIESGSECRVISANPGGLLDWRGLDGDKPHPPMSLAEAMAWQA